MYRGQTAVTRTRLDASTGSPGGGRAPSEKATRDAHRAWRTSCSHAARTKQAGRKLRVKAQCICRRAPHHSAGAAVSGCVGCVGCSLWAFYLALVWGAKQRIPDDHFWAPHNDSPTPPPSRVPDHRARRIVTLWSGARPTQHDETVIVERRSS